MSTEITDKPTQDESAEHKLNRKEVIHLGFQSKTRGEAAFNKISYIGVGYFGVTAFSVAATWLMNDKFPAIGKAIRDFSIKHGVSGTAGTIATLFTGGTIASVLPVKWLEDRKPQIVKKLDHLYYSDEQYNNDPKIAQAHKELDELPQQSWLSVFSSRVVAFAATLAIFLAFGSSEKALIKNLPGKSLDNMSTKAGRFLDGLFNKKAKDEIASIIAENEARIALPPKVDGVKVEEKMHGHDIMRDGPKQDRVPSRIFSYITLDGFYTLITSVALWVSTRIFGAIMGKPGTLQGSKNASPAEKKSLEFNLLSPSLVTEPPQVNTDTPPTKITAPTHLDRVSQPTRTAELTA